MYEYDEFYVNISMHNEYLDSCIGMFIHTKYNKMDRERRVGIIKYETALIHNNMQNISHI